MSLGLFSALGIGANLARDAYRRNQKYYGTDRELFKNNPRMQEVDRRGDEICNKVRREYEERTGKKANW